MFSQTPKVDHFIFTLVSTDLLELLPVQAIGNENGFGHLLDQALITIRSYLFTVNIARRKL